MIIYPLYYKLSSHFTNELLFYIIASVQGARNKSNTHFAAVYPPDSTNNSLPLLENEDIWWRENAVGNAVTDQDVAKGVVRLLMGALEATFPKYVLLIHGWQRAGARWSKSCAVIGSLILPARDRIAR